MDLTPTAPSKRDSSPPGRPVSESALTTYMMGHSAFQLLFSGLELGLFALLYQKPGLNRQAIARSLGLEDHAARCLLFGLAAMGLLKKSADGYANSDIIS